MKLIKRAITSWIAAAYMLLLFSGHAGKAIVLNKDLISGQDLPILLVIAVSVSLFVTGLSFLIRQLPVDDIALGLFIGLYAFTLSWQSDNIFVVLPVFVAITICIFYLFYRDKRTLSTAVISPRGGIMIMVAAAILMALFIGSVTVARYLTFSSPNYDFGIFSNMFASMARDFTQTVSSERDEIIQHFAVHFSPVYYLMLPFYMIFRSPVTLQILQALIVASGAIPLYLIARRRNLSPRASALLTVVYAAFPALSGGCMYDLHENCFLAPFLLWLFYAYERRDRLGNILLYIFGVLTLTVKEDAAVYVAFVGIYMIIADGCDRNDTTVISEGDSAKKNIFKQITDAINRFLTPARRSGIVLILGAVAWFCFTSWYLTNFGYGIMSNRYENFISGDVGLVGLIRTVLVNPALVFSEALDAEKLTFLAQMLLPLAAIPFVTRRPHRLLLLFPLLLINLMPDYQYQHSIMFQYVFGSSAFLFYASAVNLADMTPKLRRTLLALAAAGSLIFFSAFMVPKYSYVKIYIKNSDYYTSIEKVLSTVPDDASVTASTFYLPHLADRYEIYQLDDGKETQAKTDYVVFDLRYITEFDAARYKNAYIARGYNVFQETDDVLILVSPEAAVAEETETQQ